MKIVVENRIPYIKGVFEAVADVTYLPAEQITSETVRDADALLVRTRTRCNASLLEASRVRFIGSATIGTDHIDLPWCRERGIAVHNAPGCNAPAVAQWVFAAIGLWMRKHSITRTCDLTLGVIGVGHVGSIVARWSKQLGFKTLLNDPPLNMGCDLEQLLKCCDIITIHTPLIHDGHWPTRHLIGAAQLNVMSRCRLLLNAARGGIIDELAIASWQGDMAIDCWENEPRISPALLRRAIVATPHIAGYSIEGKQRGTAMIIKALNEHYGWELPVAHVTAPAKGAHQVSLAGIMSSFDPQPLTSQLREHPDMFESIRNSYPLRDEYPGLSSSTE